ncbi:hypothetical protein SBRY_60146 [Actinacidiphila bryophytorum]|uniref:Uncharacterized protein n=1 Tax=Actinacidiphila bryophytorum TaxID=1436133 RepID=A0A9W4H5Z5_9ACTN|nr:hypothetical protein SBRY_60146 [Actinacidiphila bryophytorum]
MPSRRAAPDPPVTAGVRLPLRRGAFQGRGELRDQPTNHAPVVTIPKGQFLSETDHRPVGLSAQFPAPLRWWPPVITRAPTGARVVTGPKGLLGPCRTTGRERSEMGAPPGKALGEGRSRPRAARRRSDAAPRP